MGSFSRTQIHFLFHEVEPNSLEATALCSMLREGCGAIR